MTTKDEVRSTEKPHKQRDYWQEEARRYAQNAEFWRSKYESATAQQQEPVGEITAEDMGRPFNAIRIGTHFYKEIPPVGTKLYTSPQPNQSRSDVKPWVGLTAGEIHRALDEAKHFPTDLDIAVAEIIEAKLKEKNGF